MGIIWELELCNWVRDPEERPRKGTGRNEVEVQQESAEFWRCQSLSPKTQETVDETYQSPRDKLYVLKRWVLENQAIYRNNIELSYLYILSFDIALFVWLCHEFFLLAVREYTSYVWYYRTHRKTLNI